MTVSQAIILGAGRGSRLGGALPAGQPKCLIDLGGKPLLAHQVEALVRVGVRRVTVVVGYAQDAVRAAGAVLEGRLPVEFDWVENLRFAETNTLSSLFLARNSMEGGFYLLNGDVLFGRKVVEILAESTYESAIAVEAGRCADEEVKVIVDGDRVTAIGKQLDPTACLGEAIGVNRFGPLAVAPLIDALTGAVAGGHENAFFEHAVQQMLASTPVFATAITGEPAVEIDFPADLERARREVLPRLKP